jgi:NhaP-type Na+/H+ or K+/H+ antiporter
MVVLEGESLFNDASALLVYRIAVAAAITGTFSRWSIVPMLVLTCGGGVIAGILLARLYLRVTAALQDIPISILLQFISTYGLCAFAVCAAVIVTRIVWWMSHNTIARWRIRRFGARLPRPMFLPTLGSGLIISWSGMRGIVSLAAALALPSDFPYRDLILLCAFAVVLTTLVVQGLTLRWLIEKVGVRDDGGVEREIGMARAETARVALRALESDASASSLMLREKYEARLRSGKSQSAGAAVEASSGTAALQRRVVAEQRQALLDLRAREVIGDTAFQAVEEELDLLELTADPRLRP